MRWLAGLARGLARFLAALLIGLGLAVTAQFSLLFFGAERFAGPVLFFGTFAALALALRFAISGRLTVIDRVVATVAALLSAGALIVVMGMAGLAAFGLAAVSTLFSVGGGANTAREYFGPMASQASLVMDLAMLGTAGLGFALFWLWRTRRSEQTPANSDGAENRL
jgi:hypothetical protein